MLFKSNGFFIFFRSVKIAFTMATSIYNKCKKDSCGCQRFLPKENAPDECFYCNHTTGFHESLTINITDYPYGPCNKILCGCQRFKNQWLDPLRCVHCNHYNGFHSDWSFSTHNTQTDNSSQVAIRHTRNILKIKIIICLDQNIPNLIPKFGSPLWNDLNSRNMIKENIEIPIHSSSTEINYMISNLFPDHLNGKRWCLFNSSSGILRKVLHNVNKKKKFFFFFNLS
jgi:hypothetical protein